MRAALTTTVLAALTASTLVSGCSEGPQPAHLGVRTLVSLGDSYTSGAGIPTVETDDGCQRSDHDYGALAAKELDLTYIDVSCGSATTANATQPQQTAVGTVPPQLQGVSRAAKVVTVSLGLNDLLFFTDMVVTCTELAATQPEGTPCQDHFAAAPNKGPIDRLPQIGANITAVLQAVQERAPQATVLLVGVPQIVPASGTCPELPLPAAEYAYFRRAFEGLARTMKNVATRTHVTYVDVLGPSEGHDICAGEDAWILGDELRTDGIPYHPLVAEQRAVAKLVVAAVGS